jgi:hypothetical protein
MWCDECLEGAGFCGCYGRRWRWRRQLSYLLRRR